MSCSLNSLKGVTSGIISGSSIGVKGDSRSLDYSSCEVLVSKCRGGK